MSMINKEVSDFSVQAFQNNEFKTVTKADLQGKYHIGNIRQRKNGMVLRLVGDELPEEAVRVDNDIDLEDVYLYYFE